MNSPLLIYPAGLLQVPNNIILLIRLSILCFTTLAQHFIKIIVVVRQSIEYSYYDLFFARKSCACRLQQIRS